MARIELAASPSRGARSATLSYIPRLAVPMGVAPTTSRSTTERSAVELRNHWRVEPESHRRIESLQLSALLLGDLPVLTDLDSNQDRSGQNRSCCRVAPSVNGATGGICARTPALATQCSARRTPIAYVVEPRGIEPAIRCVQDSSPTVERRPHVSLFSFQRTGASNGFRTRSCGLTNRRACPYTMLAMEPHLRFELSRSALRKRCSS